MSRVAALAVVLGALALGCGHTEVHQAMLRPAEPATGHVELYMADQPVPMRPYYEIAFVQAIGFGDNAHPETVAKALTDKAAKLGCDAVLRTIVDLGYTRAHATGVCVKWTGPGPAGTPPVLPPDHGAHPTPPPVRPNPAPRMEPLPSAGPGQGGGR